MTATSASLASQPPEWQRTARLVEYPYALARMRQRVAAIRADSAPELVWLLEHPPLYTAGTSAKREDLLQPARLPTFDAGRGGQWTYHGPGQRTIYLMLDLNRQHGQVRARDTHAYVNGLEEWLILTLAQFGVSGTRRPGQVGIWVCNDRSVNKIATIGVRISHWVSWHGVALNVAPSLDDFAGIVPCGIREQGVTSLRLLQVDASMDDVDTVLHSTFNRVFGHSLSSMQTSPSD